MATSSALSTTNTYIKYTITITQNSQDITNNKSNVTVSVRFYRTNTGYTTSGSGTVYCKINGTTYSANVTSSQEITNSGIVLFTKTLDIAHNSDGTKTLNTSAWISHSRFDSSEQSYNQALTTIPRKSSLSVGNGTLGTAQTLTVSRATTSFTHTITYTCGSASGTIVSKSTSTSISFTPPLSLASQNTTGTSVTVKYTITTYNGNTSIGSNSYSKTCSIPSSVVPTVSFTVSEYVANVKSIFGVYVKGLSKLDIVSSGAGVYNSTINSYKITANGETFMTASAITDTVISSGSLTITVTVTDSRGRTGSTSQTITVFDYQKPIINVFEGVRCETNGVENDEGNNILLTLKGSVANLSGNKAIYKIGFKKSTTNSYTYVTLTNTALSINTTHILNNIGTENTYDIIFTITDAVGNVMTKEINISTAFTLIDYHSSGKGLAIGKVSELENVLDVDLVTYSRGGYMLPVIEGNDLNTVTTPNTYISDTSVIYTNLPTTYLSNDSFILEVFGTGSNTQLSQRLTRCSDECVEIYQRNYRSGKWGQWLTVHYDTGWIDLDPLIGTWTYLRFRKCGSKVMIQGYASNFTWDGTIGIEITTIPEEYRPDARLYFNGNTGGYRFSRMGITTAGKIFLDWLIAISNGEQYKSSVWLSFTFEYYV